MDDREWAARWVGWFYSKRWGMITSADTMEGTFDPEFTPTKSDADLAEAVRVKYIDTYPISIDEVPGDPWPRCVKVWGLEGPPGFFREVREAVDGR